MQARAMICGLQCHVVYLDREGHAGLVQGVIRALYELIVEDDILQTFIRIQIGFWEWQTSNFIVQIHAWDSP